MWIGFLSLLGLAAESTDVWLAHTPFYPMPNAGDARSSSLLHIRPSSGPTTTLPLPFIPPSSIADFCHIYTVNATTQFTATGFLTVTDHTQLLGNASLTPTEMWCLLQADIQGGSDPNACDPLDGVPCTPQEMLLSTQTIRSFASTGRTPPNVAFGACNHLPTTWNLDPGCDTRQSSLPQQDCADLSLLSRLISSSCQACAWYCPSMWQCFSTVGLPLVPIFDSGSSVNIPCKDPTQCNFYCCMSQQASEDSPFVTFTSSCVFLPYVSTGSPSCINSGMMTETCNATAVWDSRTPKSTVQFRDYLCSHKCDFPCATSPSVNVKRLCSGTDGQSGCLPAAHDLMCTVNVLLDTVCPYGASTIVFKDPDLAAEVVESAFVPNGTALFPGQLQQCTTARERGCGAPVCLCLKGCPAHPSCNGHGTLFETLFPTSLVPPRCHCDSGYMGQTCGFHRPTTISCNRGQLSSARPLLYEQSFLF